MRVSFLLRNPNKKGKTAIYATLTYRAKRAILFPGESIDTANWINKKGTNKPKPIPENNALIGRLNRSEQLYRDVHDDLQKTIAGVVPPAALKKAIYEKMYPPAIEENVPILITAFFETLIADSKSGDRLGQNNIRLADKSIDTYTTALNHFIQFQNKQKRIYDLMDIDQKLIDDYSKYLNIHLKMSLNGSGKYLKIFKTLMNYARQKKLIDVNVIMDSKVSVSKEKSDNIYLTEQDIRDLMDIKVFLTPLYETVRDLFVIGCKTGLRFSDYSCLRLANINDGYIQMNQKKTNGKVTIPVHSIVEQILLKYPDGLPKCPANQVFNRYLKEIGKQLPELDKEFEKQITRSNKIETTIYKKWQLLQSHTARRSFCTNEYLKGLPAITIMSISGHKTEKSFLTYIKADSLQHARIMKAAWKNLGE